MATIGKLAVGIVANAKGFFGTINKATAKLRGFGRSAIGMATKVGGIGTALAAVAAGGGLVMLTKQAFDTLDALAKTSDKLGIMPEKLQALQLAAERSGVSSNTLNMALQRMTRRVSEAARGTGEAKAAIKELGLDAKKLHALTPDEKMKRFADAMQAIKNPADRVRLAMKLFDSEGVALVNTLAAGSKGFEDAEKDLTSMGLAFDRMSLAKIEQANDRFADVKKIIQSVFQHLAVHLAPMVTALSTQFIEATKSAGGFGKWVRIAVEWAVEKVSDLYNWTMRIIGGFKMLGGIVGKIGQVVTFGEWDEAFGELAGMLEDGKEIVDKAKANMYGRDVRRWYNETRDAANEYGLAVADAAEEQIKQTAAMDDTVAKLQDIDKIMDKLQGDLDKALGKDNPLQKLMDLGADDATLAKAKDMLDQIAESKAFDQLVKEADKLKESLLTPLEQFEKQSDKLVDMLAEGLLDPEQYAKAFAKLEKDIFGDKEIANRFSQELFAPRMTKGIERFGFAVTENIERQTQRDMLQAVQGIEENTHSLKGEGLGVG